MVSIAGEINNVWFSCIKLISKAITLFLSRILKYSKFGANFWVKKAAGATFFGFLQLWQRQGSLALLQCFIWLLCFFVCCVCIDHGVAVVALGVGYEWKSQKVALTDVLWHTMAKRAPCGANNNLTSWSYHHLIAWFPDQLMIKWQDKPNNGPSVHFIWHTVGIFFCSWAEH